VAAADNEVDRNVNGMTQPHRVVILGGGFAGVSTGQELARRLRREHRLVGRDEAVRADESGTRRPVSVTLINRDNYFVFQPLLADIISGAIETTHVVVPLRRMLDGVDVEVG
jgi:NADH:ubiquinone reductase (H+-translocating)